MSEAPDWYRRLPCGKPISALGFGCSSVWAKPAFSGHKAREVLDAAEEAGINHFDTSPSYGEGLAEQRLGEWLKGRDPQALVLSTKVGSNLVDGKIVRGFDLDLIRRTFDSSMARLGLDRVDILYLHGPSVADLDDGIFRFFDDLKSAGRITYSGVNSFDGPVLEKCAATPIDAVMLQYNVADFRLAPEMARLHAAGKIVISGTALARAQFDLRTFMPRSFKSAWYLARMMRSNRAFAAEGRRLSQRLAKAGRDPYETAIQFVTAQPEILSNLFGSTSVEHVKANALAARNPIDENARQQLLNEGAKA